MTILRPGDIEASPSDEYPIYTRLGWEIPQLEFPEMPIELLQIKTNERLRWQRGLGLKLRSLSTYPYNCVGMVFASRRAWIEIEHVYKIMEDDGYEKIARNEVAQGDVVLYKDHQGEPSHIALVVMVQVLGRTPNIQVISKWGKEAEFIHYVENVPDLLGSPAEYWTDRRTK